MQSKALTYKLFFVNILYFNGLGAANIKFPISKIWPFSHIPLSSAQHTRKVC